MHKISSTVFKSCLCVCSTFLFLILNLVFLNPLLLNLCMYMLLMMSKYFFDIFPKLVRRVTTIITQAMCVGNHPYMSIVVLRARAHKLKMKVANAFMAVIIPPISMMVQVFIIFISMLPNNKCLAPICWSKCSA